MDERPAYREVTRPESAYPMMTVSTRDGMAVVHLFRDGACFLLDGDGAVDPSESRNFRVLDIDVSFTGEFICNAARAANVADEFLRGVDADELGTWAPT